MTEQDPDCYASTEEYFLDCARYGDQPELLECLTEKVQLDCVDQNKCNAIHMCAANGHEEILKILLEEIKNASQQKITNAVNGSGNTPLHWSTLTNKHECVKILLDFGVDPDLKNEKGEKAFDIAYNFCFSECVELLAEKTEVDKGYLVCDEDETFLNNGNGNGGGGLGDMEDVGEGAIVEVDEATFDEKMQEKMEES